MSDAHYTDNAASPRVEKTYLVGCLDQLRFDLKCCPTASTLMCTELATGLDALIAIPCRRWGCKWCGQRRAFSLAMRCETANADRFITLTVNPSCWTCPRAAYDGTRRKLSDFAKAIRKQVKTFEYLRVLEVTKKGWPHYHFVARCPYIPQPTISAVWATMTGAAIVDVRRIDKSVSVFKYMLKYLCKQTYVPWTNRRVSWSAHFFPKPDDTTKRQNPFVNRKRNPRHPTEILADRYQGETIIEQRPGVWTVARRADNITPRQPFTDGKVHVE